MKEEKEKLYLNFFNQEPLKGVIVAIAICIMQIAACRAQEIPEEPPAKTYDYNHPYTIVRNDPESLPKLYVSACPLGFHLGLYGSTALSYGIEASYMLLPRVTLFGNYLRGYGKGILYGTENAINLQPFQQANAGAIIYLYKKKISDLTDITASYKDGGVSNIEIKDVPVDEVYKAGIEGGWSQAYTVLAGNETALYGYRTGDPMLKQYKLYHSDDIAGLQLSCFFAGINYCLLQDYLIKFEDNSLEDENTRNAGWFYADVVVPMSASYTNIMVTNPAEAPVGVYNLNANTPKNQLGFRAGFLLNVDASPNMTLGGEIGMQPCVPRNAAYILLKLGIGIAV